MKSVIDTYFVHVHNQPYSFFQETSFRLKLDSNALPRCLILAILASAIRFSKHAYYDGKKKEATEAYSRESWLTVLSDHLTVEENMNLSVVQAMTMLSVADYTGMIIIWALFVVFSFFIKLTFCSWSRQLWMVENRTRSSDIPGFAINERGRRTVLIC